MPWQSSLFGAGAPPGRMVEFPAMEDVTEVEPVHYGMTRRW